MASSIVSHGEHLERISLRTTLVHAEGCRATLARPQAKWSVELRWSSIRGRAQRGPQPQQAVNLEAAHSPVRLACRRLVGPNQRPWIQCVLNLSPSYFPFAFSPNSTFDCAVLFALIAATSIELLQQLAHTANCASLDATGELAQLHQGQSRGGRAGVRREFRLYSPICDSMNSLHKLRYGAVQARGCTPRFVWRQPFS
jgi:hypothetical protein